MSLKYQRPYQHNYGLRPYKVSRAGMGSQFNYGYRPYARLAQGLRRRMLAKRRGGYGGGARRGNFPIGTTYRTATRGTREMALYAPSMAVKPEMKFKDLTAATYVGDTTGTVTLLNAIDSGTELNNRLGDRVALTGLQIRGVVAAGSTGSAPVQATFAIIYDRQPQGALPAITDIYTAIASAAFQTTSSRDRFKILGRWNHVVMGVFATPTTGCEERQIDLHLFFREQVTYTTSQSSGAIGNIKTGGLYLLTYGDLAASTAAPNFSLRFRLNFADA